MISKPYLYIGIALLFIGILFRKATSYEGFGLFLILLGVILKTIYIVSGIKSGVYKPGGELYFLFVGLFCFLSGLYLRTVSSHFYPYAMIVLGLLLKAIFIVRFIMITRVPNKE